MRALASPTSLKGVLSAGEAAAALARGLRRAGAEAEELPLADGGEGTGEVLGARVVRVEEVHDAFGRPRACAGSGARGRDRRRRERRGRAARPGAPRRAGLLRAAGSESCSRGWARVRGCWSVSAARPRWTEAPDCWRRSTRCRGQRPFSATFAPPCWRRRGSSGRRRGRSPTTWLELERRFALLDHAQSLAKLPGGGAAGGLGAALASLGAELVPGAPYVLEAIGFRERAAAADLVVTGEGTVDRTTFKGKAPGEALRVCEELGVRCVVFGGRVEDEFEAVALSGDPSRATADLEELGLRLGLA